MAYLLYTCIISELRRTSCSAGVATWMSSIESDEAFLSVITLSEIRRSIELHRAKDARAAGALERWLLGLESHYAERILPVTIDVADCWGRLSPDQPLRVPMG